MALAGSSIYSDCQYGALNFVELVLILHMMSSMACDPLGRKIREQQATALRPVLIGGLGMLRGKAVML